MLDMLAEIIDMAVAKNWQCRWIARLVRVCVLGALAAPDFVDAAQLLSAVFGICVGACNSN